MKPQTFIVTPHAARRLPPWLIFDVGQDKHMCLLTLAVIALLLITAAYYFVPGTPASPGPKSSATAPAPVPVGAREPTSATVSLKIEDSAGANSVRRPDVLSKAQIPDTLPIATTEVESSLSGEVMPIDAMRNRGSATGLSAAESYLWAAGRSDHDSLGALLGFNANMSAATRSAYEALIPRLSENAAKEFEEVKGVQLLEHQVFGPNDELVRLRLTRADGSKLDESCLMRRTDSGWKRDMNVKAYILAKDVH